MAKLTDRLVRQLEPPASGNRITWDDEVTGFGVRVSAGGTKAFILNYRTLERVERRKTIGRYPTWTVTAAREEAKELLREVDRGGDPVRDERDTRDGATVADLCKRYIEDELPKRRETTRRGYQTLIDNIILPELGRRKLVSLQYEDIDALYRKLAKKTPYQANRVHSLLRRMFNLAGRWYRDTLKAANWENPAQGIERVSEEKRRRYLKPEEMARLVEALNEYPYLERVRLPRAEQYRDEAGKLVRSVERRRDTPHPARQQSANIIRLLMLTGARRGEVLAAKWEQFDLEGGTWTKPAATTKQNAEHSVPLSGPARQLLAELHQQRDKRSPYLFPGTTPDTHQTDIKNAWAALCEAASIDDLRVHDLRHSYAALLASAGFSLPLIGALLGHTQPQTTARYAHLLDDPLREATERVGAIVQGGPTAEVISITGRK